MKAHEDIERLSVYDEPKRDIAERWSRFNAEVEPLRQHLASLFKAIGDVEAAQPRMFFVSKANPPSTPSPE